MSLAALPAVLLQLLCQQLDHKSLLHLARCCRSTLAAASSTVAWRFAGPIPLRTDAADFPVGFCSSLLRFADVSLRVDYRRDRDDGAALLQAVSTVPRVVHLELVLQPMFGFDAPDFQSKFLSLPSLEGVRQLTLTLGLSSAHAALLEKHMSGLHTLLVPTQAPDSLTAQSLPRLPSLTYLAIGNPAGTETEVFISCHQLAACARLTHLRLHSWTTGHSTVLLSLPALASRLVMLELTQMRYCQPAFLPQAFAGLIALRTLSFVSCPRTVENAGSAAAQVRSLTSVRLQDLYSSYWGPAESFAYLAKLHDALRQREVLSAADPSWAPLCIEIRMQADEDWRSSLDSDSQAQEEHWTVMKEQAEALSQDTMDAKCKMTLVIDPPQENRRDLR